jgi:MYXO-CTERM domain-containing protein
MRVGPKSVHKSAVLRPLVSAVLLTLSGVNVSQADALTYLGAQGNAGGSQGLGGASRVAISPDNHNAYVAAIFDRCLGVFSQSSGVVSQLGQCSTIDDQEYNYIPVSVVVSADGKNVYAAVKARDDSGRGRVLAYDRANDGTISAQTFYGKGKLGMDDVTDLIVSGDGRHVYVTGLNAVVVFSRDVATGRLSHFQAITDNEVDGLAGSSGLSLSADGKHLYVAGSADNAVAVFARNATSGQLSFVELQRDNNLGVDGLGGAKAVALSPDGGNVYVAGSSDDAIAVFKRDSASGKLTFLEVWKDNNGVDSLNGASAVVVSPNGSRVFVGASSQVGTTDNAITVFRRLSQSGKLEFLEAQKDGVNGVDGLHNVLSITLNPTGAYLFAASLVDSTGSVPVDVAGKVAVFKTANDVPQPSPDAVEVMAGESISIQVLANDTDPDNDVLRVSGADDKSKQGGIVTVNADHTITYTAPIGFEGSDTFNYFVTDVRDAPSVVAVVTLSVKAAGDLAPVVSAASAESAEEGGGGSVDGWLGLLLLGAGVLRRRFVI